MSKKNGENNEGGRKATTKGGGDDNTMWYSRKASANMGGVAEKRANANENGQNSWLLYQRRNKQMSLQ